jgi:hypothetical protein
MTAGGAGQALRRDFHEALPQTLNGYGIGHFVLFLGTQGCFFTLPWHFLI